MLTQDNHSEPLSVKDFHILYTLALGPLHGYALVKDVEERTGGAVTLDPANLYRRLHRFAHDGLIEEAKAPEGEDDGRRRYYRLTEPGRRAVEAEVSRMSALVSHARRHGVRLEASSG